MLVHVLFAPDKLTLSSWLVCKQVPKNYKGSVHLGHINVAILSCLSELWLSFCDQSEKVYIFDITPPLRSIWLQDLYNKKWIIYQY